MRENIIPPTSIDERWRQLDAVPQGTGSLLRFPSGSFMQIRPRPWHARRTET
jgi:hypothetical protein